MPHYLLPCSCGRSIEVALSQAGQMVTCDCGLRQEVPTLLGLKKLPVVEDAKPMATASTWSPLQGKLFVAGIAVLLLFGGLAVFFGVKAKNLYFEIPPANRMQAEKEAEKMTFDQTLDIWNKLSDQHRHPLGSDPHPAVKHIKEDNELSRYYWLVTIISAGMAILGIFICGAAFLVPTSNAPIKGRNFKQA